MTNVTVASFFEEEHVERIRAVDERARVLYRPDLVPPPQWPGDHAGPEGWSRSPEAEEDFLALLAEAEVIFDFPRGHLEDLTSVAPKLRWVQSSAAGAGEPAARAGLQDADVIVTTAGGVFSDSLAEFVLGAMLHHAKAFDRLRRDREGRRWREATVGTLWGKTLCVVGMGSIGRAVADRARPFGMRVTGVKRAVSEEDEAWNSADKLYPTEDLHAALAEADYVAVTLPGTPETRRLLDAEAIGKMKREAFFVNVGRGSVVDETALVATLAEGRLSGAALDVFEEEPLPEESPLWRMENVLLSPHATDNVPELNDPRLVDLFCENLRRYLDGEELINVLDKRLLY